MSLAKKPGRWDCVYPSGVGYGFRHLRFPRCLSVWRKQLPVWTVAIHGLSHFGVDVHKANLRLLKLGLLYSARDGGILTWQWRFWRSSPLARAMKDS